MIKRLSRVLFAIWFGGSTTFTLDILIALDLSELAVASATGARCGSLLEAMSETLGQASIRLTKDVYGHLMAPAGPAEAKQQTLS